MTVAVPRLKTDFWVRALIRRGDLYGVPVFVMHRGDPASGAVLLKRNGFDRGCTVLVETVDRAGDRAWCVGTGPDPVTETVADTYIARSRNRDPDLWVIEIEDRTGRLPFDEKIL